MVNSRKRLSSLLKFWLPERSRSPSILSTSQQANANSGPLADRHDGEDDHNESQGSPTSTGKNRKIMVVLDSNVESKVAFQWALIHAIQSQDVVILLQLITTPKQESKPVRKKAPGAFELANSLKNMCRLSRPEVQVEIAMAEGKEKGPLIVEEARKRDVAVLVLGQKKRSAIWRLVMRRRAPSTVDHCIQNADCMAIAVRRKSRRHGGYLVTTKRLKDFWLLA